MNQRADLRTYGVPPYQIAVVHGGPGAPGYMAPVARELSKQFGVVEPLQNVDFLEGQIDELHSQVKSLTEKPLVLIGSSWGAVLILLTAARYPDIARKLILVGSAVFDKESSRKVKAIRLDRTPPGKLARIQELECKMKSATRKERSQIFGLIADLEFDPDVYEPITRDLELLDTQIDLNQKVWADFVKLRDEPGRLHVLLSDVRCDTLIVHGDYDPHVIEGIQPFLKSCIPHVRLEWLEKCGHYPWIEKKSKDQFFEILHRECAE